jgi:sporulation protein YhbH
MAIQNIEKDHSRFRDIVKGAVRQNLKRYISKGEILGREGRKTVSIPIPQIEIPRFRFKGQGESGVGQGDGEEGDALGGQEENGEGKAGDKPGEHALETEITVDELAEILGEELQLPRIKPKGTASLKVLKNVFTGISKVGPESLRHFKRSYREALKRQIAAGLYDPDDPAILITRDDKRYRSFKTQMSQESNAVIIYMMDVSGSMGEEQKQVVRIESFWIDTWLRHNYKGIVSRYIIHDAKAREVDRETFFRTKESGGTMISSAYSLCAEIMDTDYPGDSWNIYPFHFSDGDNWSNDDTLKCMELLRTIILKRANIFCYGQVRSPYGSGQFVKDLRKHFPEEETLVLSEIPDRDGIVQSIKDFFGKGK